jgi:hypothetical protein
MSVEQPTSLGLARIVADAVLYEGYLLYPYRSSSRKNQVRWQFGVLGPPGAADAAVGEEPELAVQCLLRPGAGHSQLEVHLRFLQLQVRSVERAEHDGTFTPVEELRVDGTTHLGWDEAVEREVPLGAFSLAALSEGVTLPTEVPGGQDVAELSGSDGTIVGRLVRRREPLAGVVQLSAVADGGFARVEARVRNVGPDPQGDKQAAIRTSFIGTHLLLGAHSAGFVSVIDPSEDARAAAARCVQRRCWPVLAGPEGATDVVLAAPIILYDYPTVAPESAGALFDSTEIDEILTLRVMTLTDEEKAAARATDAHAAAIIDRCDQMSPQELQRLHGVLRDPRRGLAGPMPGDEAVFGTDGVPWWDPAADASVRPEADSVVIAGTSVARGSVVRVHPSRRADAQDMFFAGQLARVDAVHRDVDGETHVAVVLVDDPAAEMHDWYGRYLYFAPDELEPVGGGPPHHAHGEEGLR